MEWQVMKRLIILIAVLFTTTAQANDVYFQKTYTVEGMDADSIKQAFGSKMMVKEDGAGLQVSNAFDTLKGGLTGNWKKNKKQEYPVKCNYLGNSFYADADIILQAKDNTYRVTIANVIDADSGKSLNKMNPKFAKKCVAQMEQWADKKFELVNSLSF
jgi:hypothetical protein